MSHLSVFTPPDGMVYEWKREFVLGHYCDHHLKKLAKDGWTPVPATRHTKGTADPADPLREEGMLLMERPLALQQEEALSEDSRAASFSYETATFPHSGASSIEDEFAWIEALEKEIHDILINLKDYGWPEPTRITRTSYSSLTIVWIDKDNSGLENNNYITWAANVFMHRDHGVALHFSGVGNFRRMLDKTHIMSEGSFHGVCEDRSAADIAAIINQFKWVLDKDQN
jgi:hypothetical protein